MDIEQNHFLLFGLPERFAIDAAGLDAAFQRLQGEVHPDRFANADAAVRRAALQWATRANEAYQVLKHPLSRARYLCELQGIDVATESNTEMSADFLMAQLAWRETLEDAARGADLAALEALDDTLQKACSEETEALAQLLDQDQNYAAAAQGVRRLMFLDKTRHDVGRALDGLAA